MYDNNVDYFTLRLSSNPTLALTATSEESIKIQEFDENNNFQVWKLTKVNFVDTKLENKG